MRRHTTAIGVLCLLLVVCAQSMAGAQEGSGQASYHLDAWTIGLGGSASGGGYTLEYSAGVPDAGAASSAEYTMTGGYWGGQEGKVWYVIYLPIVLRE
jgi:hypothetical protein